MDRLVVGVSADVSLPGAPLALDVLVGTLWRMSANVVLVGDFPLSDERRLTDLTKSIDPERSLGHTGHGGEVDVRIHLGTDPKTCGLRVIPDNHGVRLTRRPGRVLRQSKQPSALGSVVAASVAAAEVYKTLVDAAPAKHHLVEDMAFCPVTLSDRPELAPSISDGIKLNAALIGLGAIGTCNVLILSKLGISGTIILCDMQAFAIENVGTYSYGTLADALAGKRKVEMAAELLDGFEVKQADGTVAELLKRLEAGEFEWPSVALTGLDSAEHRYKAQQIYPPQMIDTATGGTVVSLHDSRPGAACIRCLLPEVVASETSPEQLADLLGVPIEIVSDGDRILTEEDVLKAKPEYRHLLEAGKPVCSIPSAKELTELDTEGFDPAAPFVAQLASCLGIGRLIAAALGVAHPENFVQIDTMFGVEQKFISRENRARDAECFCVKRANTIKTLREDRYGVTPEEA